MVSRNGIDALARTVSGAEYHPRTQTRPSHRRHCGIRAGPRCRGAYQMLFQEHRTRKCYECLAPIRPLATPRTGTVVHGSPPRIWPLVRRSRIRKTRGVLCAQEIPGQVNAETAIELEALHARMSARMGMSIGVYRLLPRTGKTHQLRVHMNSLGLPIVGDDFYPRIEERATTTSPSRSSSLPVRWPSPTRSPAIRSNSAQRLSWGSRFYTVVEFEGRGDMNAQIGMWFCSA